MAQIVVNAEHSPSPRQGQQLRSIDLLRATQLPPLAIGICLFCALFALGGVPVVLDLFRGSRSYEAAIQSSFGLFINTAAISYSVAMFYFITFRFKEILTELAALSPSNESQLRAANSALTANRHPKALTGALVIGLCYGSFAALTDFDSDRNMPYFSLPSLNGYWVLYILPLLWVVIAYMSVLFVANARLMGQVVRSFTSTDLFDLRPYHLFVSAGVLQTLLLVGALSLLPLQSILVRDVGWWDFSTALIVVVLLIFMALRHPVWDVRTKIAAARNKELEAVDARIRDFPQDLRAASLEFVSLVAYRKAVENIEPLPLSNSNTARLILFAIIPPLTWAAAAVISYWVTEFMAQF